MTPDRTSLHCLHAALLALALLLPGRAVAVENWEEAFADVLTGVIPLGSGYAAHNKGDKEGRRQWFWSTITTQVVNGAARLAFNNHEYGTRPNGHPYGFPSGHVAFLGSSAAFLQDRYGSGYGIPAWLVTGYVGYVRVETDHHRWRDVLAAGAVAWSVSQFLVTRRETGDVARLTPLIGPDVVGLSWERTF